MFSAEQIATLLLEIKAVNLNLKQPYRYSSGILSPIYCDNRLTISYPEKRNIILNAFLELIKKNHLQFDVVAGTATAGIPHAAWIADRLNKPMVYVRNKAKQHGKQNLIEGAIQARQTALVIEDLVSTGESAISAGQALRDADATVTDCVAIFNYQMQKAEQQFAAAKIALHTLCNFTTLIEVAVKKGYINQNEKTQALAWNQDPVNWGKKMGYE